MEDTSVASSASNELSTAIFVVLFVVAGLYRRGLKFSSRQEIYLDRGSPGEASIPYRV
jgi:hypothetical protein